MLTGLQYFDAKRYYFAINNDAMRNKNASMGRSNDGDPELFVFPFWCKVPDPV